MAPDAGQEVTGEPTDDRRRSWPRSVVIVVAVASAYSLIVIGLCGAGIWGARAQTLRMVHAQAAAIAAFSAAYTSRMYDLSDEVTRRLADELTGAPLEGTTLTPLLVDAAEGTAQNDYFVVFDADGDLVASSQPMQPFRAQPDVLSTHLAGADRFVGQVVKGKTTKEVIYRLSRRIPAPDGKMAGIVGAAIRPFGIRRTHERSPKDPQVTVWTDGGEFIAAAYVDFRADGSAIAPPKPADLGTLVPGQVKDESGHIRSEAKVEGLPLWVSADFDREGVLASWRTVAAVIALLGAFLLAMGWGFAFAGLRVLARDEAARARLTAAKAEAEGALHEREMLLREIHHRVRNSLMLVSSFVTLQARASDPKMKAALEAVRARVTSIGVVHETLYAGSHLGMIRLTEYLARLLPELSASLGAEERGVVILCEADDITIPGDQASTVGLIVSEAVTNAVKYAFGDAGGTVRITARPQAGGRLELSVIDDGKGVPRDRKTGLGSQLLDALARQLGGTCSVVSRKGTTVRVVFPLAGGLDAYRNAPVPPLAPD